MKPSPSPLRAFVLLAALVPCFLSTPPHATAASPGAHSPAIPTPPAAEILKTLRAEHPRLYATRADFERLRTLVNEDPVRKAWWNRLKSEADRLMTVAPVKYDIPDGLRLLNVSRRVVERSYTLAFAWRITGDRRYADRLMREFEVVATFKDWNPRHFLDTAEMCHGIGLGYDWCHDAWSPIERAVVRTALIEKGFAPALQAYRNAGIRGGWPLARHNWNQVCNGGLAIAALAVADEAPETASEIVAFATASIQHAMAEYGPDGAWPEGPAYWNYATIYNVAFLASLESALGTDFGLSGIPGFSRTALFPMHVTGPRDRTFNYADGRDGPLRGPQLFWLAKRFDLPLCAREQRDNASAHPLDFIWYDEQLAARTPPTEPLDRYFRGVELVTLRSAWTDDPGTIFSGRKAIFVGFKAGDNKANHSHLDLGTFVLDAGGLRWALDQGAESYNVPGYFGTNRWDYYLTRAEGHNTLVLNPDSGPDQDPKAAAKIVQFVSRPAEAFAVADLTPAYARHARRVYRGIALQANRSEVLVQDEIEAATPADVWWFLHTIAKVEVNGRTAHLSYGTHRLTATLLGGGGATFSVTEAGPLPTSPKPATQTKASLRRLAIRFPQVRDTRFAVHFAPARPGADGSIPAPQAPLVPLAEWK